MTYEELKTRNRKAHSALITLWEELSRTSRATARKDLKEDWGWRYSVATKESSLQFTDSHAGQSFLYVEARNEWV